MNEFFLKIINVRVLLCGLMFIFISSDISAAPAKITPSHVFQNSERLIAQVNLLRTHKSITDLARTAGVQIKKTPLHVYGKCIEVIEKVIRLQQQAKVKLSSLPTIPMRAVTPAEVFACTEQAMQGLNVVKTTWQISTTISEPAFVDGKTPSHVYRNLWQVSYLLDGLVGQISPSHVFRNTQLMQQDIDTIATSQGSTLIKGAVGIVTGKTPRDVLLQCFQALTKLKKVARKLGLKGLKVPKVPAGTKILPSDVYDCTNTHLTEMHALKLHLNITQARGIIAVPSGKKPADVYAQMVIVNQLLSQLKAK